MDWTFARWIWRCIASFVRGRESRFFFTLWNEAYLSLSISTPSVPWLYSSQTNASASARTLASGGQSSPRCSISLSELSKTFQVNCLPMLANWLVVSQPVMAWKASSDFLFSSGNVILWTSMYLFLRDVPENIQISSQRSCLCATRKTRTSVSRHSTLTCF